jgi:hypothetical protein
MFSKYGVWIKLDNGTVAVVLANLLQRRRYLSSICGVLPLPPLHKTACPGKSSFRAPKNGHIEMVQAQLMDASKHLCAESVRHFEPLLRLTWDQPACTLVETQSMVNESVSRGCSQEAAG